MLQDNESVIISSTVQQLDSWKKETPNGVEFWLARDLQELLGYAEWRHFEGVIEKAKVACTSVGRDPRHHFGEHTKMIAIGKGASREVRDVALTRLACYLVAMNANPKIREVAEAQHYFAQQTRKQEIQDKKEELEGRLELRSRVTQSVKELNEVAKNSGVLRYDWFTSAGYRGLYGGMELRQIKVKKGIEDKEQLFDCAGTQELAANYFKNTQAEAKLRREHVKTQQSAIEIHHETAKEVRNTIEKLGGVMPEDLPAEPSLKAIDKGSAKKELPPPQN